jgi:hypothetical protein
MNSLLQSPDEHPPAADIDFSKLFVPERLTPLFYTSWHGRLSPKQRLRYNQFYGCYMNEQILFFETTLTRNVLEPFLSRHLSEPLKDGLTRFIAEEQQHSRMFRLLNQRCAPQFYTGQDFYFVRVPGIWKVILDQATQRPTWFPLFIWLMLIQEERSMYYSRNFLKLERELEPSFVATHRKHLADEVDHVRWDEELLDIVWGQSPSLVREMNAKLFSWMLGEFFNTPRRAGLRMVEELVREFPELSEALTEMRQQILDLGKDQSYHLTLYSREIVPKTFARFDRWPEFSRLQEVLPGYHPDRKEYGRE